MIRRLLIVDRYDAADLAEVVATQDVEVEWDVLLLGLSNAEFCATTSPAHQSTPRWRLVDPVPHADAAADQCGQFLVDLIERLPRTRVGGTTLHELLRIREGSLWWLLVISEKGPFRGTLLPQLYKLALIRSVLQAGTYSGVRIDVAEVALAQALRSDPNLHAEFAGGAGRPEHPARRLTAAIRSYVYSATAEVGRLLAVWSLLLWWRHGTTRAPSHGLASFTFYPNWWGAPFSSKPSDRFFAQLDQTGLAAHLAWLALPGELWRNRGQAGRALRALKMIPLQGHVRLSDLWDLVAPRRFANFLRFERGMRPRLTEPFAGFDVGPLVGDELSRSLAGSDPLSCLLMARALTRCVAGSTALTVLFRLEFQPYENALVWGLRGRARSIGFLHYPFGRHYLSTRFTPMEMARYLRAEDPTQDRPLPDGVIACGPVGITHLAESGYPTERCEPCGPQRFGRLATVRRQADSRAATRAKLGLPQDRTVYCVTLAIVEADTEALFAALAAALEKDPAAHLVVRPHPNRPDGDPALLAALRRLGPDRAGLMNRDHDLYDHLVAANALVCIGSMVAFEAMSLGCMPVVFENPSTFPALSLAEFADSLFVVRDEQELANALNAVAHESPEFEDKKHLWSETLSRVLGDLDRSLPDQLTGALARLVSLPPLGASSNAGAAERS